MAGKSSAFNLERFFQALGDNTRLRLLNLMGDQEICVCYFVEILGRASRKFPGIWLIFAAPESLRPGGTASGCTTESSCLRTIGAAQVLRQTLAWLKEERAMQADRMRLSQGVLQSCESSPRFRVRLYQLQLISNLLEA